MRRYGLYDSTRGLTTALAAGVAGLLLWVATQVGVQSTGRFWAAMGIVAEKGADLQLPAGLEGQPAAGRRRGGGGHDRLEGAQIGLGVVAVVLAKRKI